MNTNDIIEQSKCVISDSARIIDSLKLHNLTMPYLDNNYFKDDDSDDYLGDMTLDDLELSEYEMDRLVNNGVCIPGVDRVVYNLKTSESEAKRNENGDLVIDNKTGKPERSTTILENPVLATTIFFHDGTRSTVVNTMSDPVDTKLKVLNPTETDPEKRVTVRVATDRAKELGVIYALIKRLYGNPEPNRPTIYKPDGLSNKLKALVDDPDIAYDSTLEDAKRRFGKQQNKAAIKEKMHQTKKEPNPRYLDIARKLDNILTKLNNSDLLTKFDKYLNTLEEENK